MKQDVSDRSMVSVIIPCYNDGVYIEDAIRSILNQTYQNYTITLVDDGSNDPSTINKLKSLKYPKTTVLFKDNGGVSSARNYGVKHSDSEYILFFDADDVFEKTFLEKAVKILDENQEIGVVTCHERFFYEDNFEHTINYFKPKGGGVENFLIENNACSNSLVRRRCWHDVDGYDEQLLSHEDWDFWIRITKTGWLVYTIQEVLSNYRVTKKSKYNKYKSKKPELIKKIIENNKDIYKEYVVECLYEKEKEILKLKEQLISSQEKMKNSYQYRVGSFCLYPVRIIKKAINIVKNTS